jgi:hydroxymethylpyrimidine pyrophosphatase-like HAD family hydrolase
MALRYQLLAVDYDGTIAMDGAITAAGTQALALARSAGMRLALVTGRFFDELAQLCPDLNQFDLVIAENGAVIHVPAADVTVELGEPPANDLREALQSEGVPHSVGRVMLASKRVYAEGVQAALAACRAPQRMILNKNDLMLLPPGIDKGSGMRAGLEQLWLAPADAIGVGDGENDLELFAGVGLRVAVANAAEPLKQAADMVTAASNGAGVLEALQALER